MWLMPKQNPKIFASTNNNYVHNFNQAGGGAYGTYIGMCGGLSILWLNNMLSGFRDVISKPDEGRAQLVQVKMRWDPSDANFMINMIQSVELNGAAFSTAKGVSIAADEMASKGGAFLICNGDHVMAAIIKPGKFYFYDSEDGLYLHENRSDWKLQISMLGYGNRYPQPWSVWTVTK
jgi:hypothetical protein